MNKKPRAIDLFSGCGGLSRGLRTAGYSVVAAVENEPLACKTYELNHPRTKLIKNDIVRVDPKEIMGDLALKAGELELLAGCPPCQGFSTLRTLNGSKRVSDPMNDLVFQFVRFVRVLLPKTIMMENVPALIKDQRLISVEQELAGLGYNTEARILDAADFGTPQRRRRMVLIAARGKKPMFGKKSNYRKSVRWAFSNLEKSEVKDDPLHEYSISRAAHVERLIQRIPVDGGSRSDLPEREQLQCHQRCSGFYDVYGRMSWLKPAPTITGGCINPSKGRFLHPTEDRAITLREASVLQGFPIRYKFDLSKGRYPVAQLIGNAFPPKFAEAHARSLLQIIRK